MDFRALLQMDNCGVDGGQRVVALHSSIAMALCTRRRERWGGGASDAPRELGKKR